MKPESIRVHAPSTVVFLCGGYIDSSLASPKMLRDAFYRLSKAASHKFQIVLAEDADPLTSEAGYTDLFSFESDIAQIVGLILLFAESPGSLAELGAFAALDNVAPNLLAVLDDVYYNSVSFIRNGPVRFLENRYGEEWILVLDRSEVGIDVDGSLATLNDKAFSSSIFPVVENRLSSNPKWSKVDVAHSGHGILFMTGLCQEFGALTISEIRSYLDKFGFDTSRLNNYIYCAQLLGWIKRVRRGHHIFYVAAPLEAAVDYSLEGNSSDKVRWRADVRSYWQKNDPSRFKVISEAVLASMGAA